MMLNNNATNPSTFRKYARPILSNLTLALFMSVLGLSFQVIADQNAATDDVPRLIPYKGYLDRDGQPMTALGEWIRFDVLDGSPAEGEVNNRVVYSQSMQVNVHDGKFTALLGPVDDSSGVALQAVIAGADRLSVQMTMLGNHDAEAPETTADDDVVLTNPKPLHVSPFGVWATSASNFRVSNDVRIAGDANLRGDVSLGGNANLTTNTFSSNRLKVSRPITVGSSTMTAVHGTEAFRDVSVSPFSEPLCANACGANNAWVNDGECDDGGPGSQYSGCALGTDCGDCGPRESIDNNVDNWTPGTNMTDSASSICLLTEHTADFGDPAMLEGVGSGCRIIEEGGFWKLQSVSRRHDVSAIAQARCEARCIDWTPGEEEGECGSGKSCTDELTHGVYSVCRSGQCVDGCKFSKCFDEGNIRTAVVGSNTSQMNGFDGHMDATWNDVPYQLWTFSPLSFAQYRITVTRAEGTHLKPTLSAYISPQNSESAACSSAEPTAFTTSGNHAVSMDIDVDRDMCYMLKISHDVNSAANPSNAAYTLEIERLNAL